MELPPVWWVILLSATGVVVGLGALANGMLAYRATLRVGDTGTSTISSLAAGEVRVSGVIEPAELTLVSLLTSTPCVYYRATVGAEGEGSPIDDGNVDEERSVGFRVRDATGSIRVFPRGAKVDAPVRLDEATGAMGDEPPGLALRVGPATVATEPDRVAAISALLRLHDPATSDRPAALGSGERRRRYREMRLEPGDAVTVVGRALPFGDLSDPVAADIGTQADLRPDDPEVAADLAAAREAGILTLDPAAAWGNAAIAGFGIGRPVSQPVIEAGGQRPADRLGGGTGPHRPHIRDCTGRSRPRVLRRGPAADRSRVARRGGGAEPRQHDARPPGSRPGDRLCDGIRGPDRQRARAVTPAQGAALFAVGLVILVAGYLLFATYNAVVALQQRVDKAWANIDVVLKQRHDQLPNLVAAVRGVMQFEQDTLTEVTRARAAYAPTAPIPEQALVSEATTAAVRQLFAVVENYPGLKSQANVGDLQDEIERLENMIADRRELYNDQVYRFNTRIAQVPALLLAPLFGWTQRAFFAALPGETATPDTTLRSG